MQSLGKTEKVLVLKIDTEELSTTQVRLIKSLNSLIASVLTAEDETEYFEVSAELMRKTAEIIKHSTFANAATEIPYGDQAIEFAVDFLNENMNNQKIGNLDN